MATAKLIDHIPVERQCRILAREGVRLSPNTVLDWFPAMGQLLKPLFQALLQVTVPVPSSRPFHAGRPHQSSGPFAV
ncbi:MAG: IS66 family transposase [Acidobacteriaceae bacterium]